MSNKRTWKEGCQLKWTMKGYARVDNITDLMKPIRATTIFSEDEDNMKPEKWNAKVAQMRKLTNWLEWFLEEGQRVFWIGCVTIIRNNPELTKEIQAINSAIASTAQIMRNKTKTWKKVMIGTNRSENFKAERKQLQEDLKLYTAASELWLTVCNKMRPNEPRLRILQKIQEKQDEDLIIDYEVVKIVLDRAQEVEEADVDEEMAAYLPLWVFGKFWLIIEGVNSKEEKQDWFGYWKLVKETTMFLEHLGMDEWVGPKMIWFSITDKKDKERIYARGHNLFQLMIQGGIRNMKELRSKVMFGLEGIGLMWMWVWLFAATPLTMAADIAETMVDAHNKIDEISVTVTNTFLQAIDEDEEKEEKEMKRLMTEITNINEDLKAMMKKVLEMNDVVGGEKEWKEIIEMKKRLSETNMLEGKSQRQLPTRTRNPTMIARGKMPSMYILKNENNTTMMVNREWYKITMFSEIIGAKSSEHNNSYRIRNGMIKTKIGQDLLQKFDKQGTKGEKIEGKRNVDFEETWEMWEEEKLDDDDYFREYWGQPEAHKDEIMVLAGNFSQNEIEQTTTRILITEERKQSWNLITNEQKKRKEENEKEMMSGEQVQWRCTCNRYIRYMERKCQGCERIANHLSMIAMTVADWKIWEDTMKKRYGQEIPQSNKFPYRVEFMNAGIICTYEQYEEWRNMALIERDKKKIGVATDKYVRKKINEYNIQKILEIKLTGKCNMNTIINERRIKTLDERLEEVKQKIRKTTTEERDRDIQRINAQIEANTERLREETRKIAEEEERRRREREEERTHTGTRRKSKRNKKKTRRESTITYRGGT